MFATFEDAKNVFDISGAVVDLLRGIMPPEMVEACDKMEQLSTQDDGLSQSFGDAVWRIRFRPAEAEGWLYLLLVLEFQSTVGSDMASRVYVGQPYRKLRRDGELPKGSRLPPVLLLSRDGGVRSAAGG